VGPGVIEAFYAGVDGVRALFPGTSDEEFLAAADWVAHCQDGRF